VAVPVFLSRAFRHTSIYVRKDRVHKPEDLKGIKIRTPPDPITLDIFNALGANPAPLAFSELYIALQQGVFDGQENPLVNIHSSKLFEVQKFISLTGHKYEATPLFASKVEWAKLSKQDQQAVREAATEAVAAVIRTRAGAALASGDAADAGIDDDAAGSDAAGSADACDDDTQEGRSDSACDDAAEDEQEEEYMMMAVLQ
jgi:TRAP-type C4-dicarboxylate transport system substrate-binding protein